MSLISAISAQPNVTHAIKQASVRTGTDFDYLMKTAMRESNLETQAKAKTSSAAGLFQFIEQTWLGTMKQHGAELGYGQFAQAIQTTSNGRHIVPDRQMKQEILALRHDAAASSLMAGALTSDMSEAMERATGREPSQGELYMGHFLGTGGAIEMMKTLQSDPNGKAPDYFPQAAEANRAIFYDPNGAPRSVKEVYANLISKHGGTKTPAPAMPENAVPGRVYMASREFTPSTQRYGAPGDMGGAGFTGMSLPGAGGGMKLTPAVIDILASLDIPFGEEPSSMRKAANDAYQLPGALRGAVA